MVDRALTKYSASKILSFIETKKENFWSREREKRPVLIFREAAKRVPAYKDFLKKHRINPDKIKTFKDFELLPTTDKKSYLREYPLEKLCWDGTLKKQLVFTATSGSTGEPFYFPRGHQLDWEYSIISELFLRNSSYKEEPILIIICLGMGVWIAGVLNYQAFKIAAERGKYSISILTPGINKGEILKAIRLLSPNFRQTILLGYPPFLKDIIDDALSLGIDIKKLNIRFLSGAEAFTEKFRDQLVKEASIRSPYLDTLNVYGTADIGSMAWETPISILIRRLAVKRTKFFESIFSQINKTPTLAQYNPLFITFEAVNEDIILTGNSAIPLVRYAVGDHGGVLSFRDVTSKAGKCNFDLKEEARKVGIEKSIYKLPFVYVYERKDLSTTLYGLQIYPEIIKEALLDEPHGKFLTGKFSMLTKFDKKNNQYLEINLELRKNAKYSEKLREQTLKYIVLNLRSKISEFRELHDYLKDRALPRLVFWPYEHSLHFQPGSKQKWVIKEHKN